MLSLYDNFCINQSRFGKKTSNYDVFITPLIQRLCVIPFRYINLTEIFIGKYIKCITSFRWKETNFERKCVFFAGKKLYNLAYLILGHTIDNISPLPSSISHVTIITLYVPTPCQQRLRLFDPCTSAPISWTSPIFWFFRATGASVRRTQPRPWHTMDVRRSILSRSRSSNSLSRLS